MTMRSISAAAMAAAAAVSCALAEPAAAAETIAYSYDAKGRLIQVKRTDGAGNTVTTTYEYDKANNRTKKVTTTS